MKKKLKAKKKKYFLAFVKKQIVNKFQFVMRI